MAAITVKDLRTDCTLDRKTLSSVNGGFGGAPWVFGWISPYIEDASARFRGVINFYQTNNFYIADQMNVQLQTIDIKNSAANATINVTTNQTGVNTIQ